MVVFSHCTEGSCNCRLEGDTFRKQVDEYLRPAFRKGIPSLMVSIKDLYTSPEKAQIVEELVLGYKQNLKSHQQFGPKPEKEQEPPTAYLWVLYFLAQHFDHKRETTKALEFIDEALTHTPTLVELLMTKAKIYKV